MTTTQRPPTQDHKSKSSKSAKSAAAKAKQSARRAEVSDEPIDFDFDGETWTFAPRDATSLDFLAALEDEQLISACRMLLGHEQAARLFHGRQIDDLFGFFESMGEAADTGNP